MMTENMTAAELNELASGMAGVLTENSDRTWTVTAEAEHGVGWPSAILSAPDGAALKVQFGYEQTGKVTVTGLLPEGTHLSSRDCKRYGVKLSASMDPARGAAVLAREASRRVLLAGYLDILPGKQAQKLAADARQAARDAWLDRAAELFGVDRAKGAHGDKLYLSDFTAWRSEASMAGGYNDQDPLRMNLELNGLPPQVALDVLAVLAKATSANCCYKSGPGHHPDLATYGCLREYSERGERESEVRVRRLLIEHGAGLDDITRALAYVRTYGRPTNAVGDTHMVPAFDFDLCEYTVSVPRKGATS